MKNIAFVFSILFCCCNKQDNRQVNSGDKYIFTFDKHENSESIISHTLIVLDITDSTVRVYDYDFIMFYTIDIETFNSHSKKLNIVNQ